MTDDREAGNRPHSSESERIDYIVEIWRKNRLLYPGWVVLPPNNRKSLWTYTEHWVLPILRAISAVQPLQKMSWIRELTWRYELCLMPLFEEYAAAISDVLWKISPFSDPIFADQHGVVRPSDEDGHDWANIREGWLSLALSLLRYYRETSDEEKFEFWASTLESVSSQFPDLPSAILYQRCILAFEKLDQQRAEELSKQWSREVVSEPFWKARQASVLAELGNLDAAHKLATQALAEIREANSRAPDIGDDIHNLSREGWALALVSGITRRLRMFDTEANPNFRGRWEQLSSSRCNPWHDLAGLDALLAPNPPPPAFLMNTPTRLHLSSSDGLYQRLQPALQAGRLLEEAGYPVGIPNIRLGDDLLKRVAKWLSAEMPARALALLLRVGSDEAIREFLSLERTVLFSIEDVNYITKAAGRALDRSIQLLKSLERPGNDVQISAARNDLLISLRLLWAVVYRLSPKEIEEIVQRVLELRREPKFARDIQPYRLFEQILVRGLDALGVNISGSLVLAIIGQPLLGDGYNTPFNDRDSDPVWHLFNPRISFSRVDESTGWSIAIEALIRGVQSDNPDTRYQAAIRVAWLERLGALSVEEHRRFASEFWAYTPEGIFISQKFGELPPWIVLILPELESGSAENAFRRMILGRELSSFRTTIDMPNGTKRPGWSIGAQDNSGMLRAVMLTAPGLLQKPNELYFLPRVLWSPSEMQVLLENILKWWTGEGREFRNRNRERENDPFSGFGANNDRFELILNVITHVFFPALPDDLELANEVSELLLEFEQTGLVIELAKPVLLATGFLSEDGVAFSLRKALVSGNEDGTKSALDGLRVWISGAARGLLPNPPSDLLEELAAIVRMRREPCLAEALSLAADILNFGHLEFSERLVPSVRIGLTYLLGETRYGQQRGERKLASDKLPHIRFLAVRLAYALKPFVKGEDDTISAWEEEMRTEAFGPVWRASGWEEN